MRVWRLAFYLLIDIAEIIKCTLVNLLLGKSARPHAHVHEHAYATSVITSVRLM